jgi:chromosome segregation ATPase
MKAYLDKEAILKEIEKRRDFDEETYELKRKIERGEFDATPIVVGFHTWKFDALTTQYKQDLARKDAEIARLTDQIKKERFGYTVAIEAQQKKIDEHKGRIANYQKGEENLILENQKMGDRISDLEKNNVWQREVGRDTAYLTIMERIEYLTMRVDNLESRLETCFKRHGVYETRTHETNSKIIELETTLKSLQVEVAAICPEQPQ